MSKKEAQPKKTETLTLRLDPKMKFAIELLARDQKRTLAGAIEWAVQKALASQQVTTGADVGNLQMLVDRVWSPDDLERVLYLGIFTEHLLSFEEQCLWLVVRDNPHFLEVQERDAAGRIASFVLRKARIDFCRDLIEKRAGELRDGGRLRPISLDEIKEAGGSALEMAESLNVRISPEKWERGFD
ncbi:hypothetical protein L3X16_11160 [Pseudomonas stutzeri]|jgi:hypothetical protein|nr:hypothetical protein [Stutzerimonas stutzeri]